MANLQSNKLTLIKVANGSSGKGISTIIEQYAINNSGTVPPSESSQSWSNSYTPPTAIDRYLWNREIITYTDSTSSITTPHVAAMYAEDGGEGRGISGISNSYAISNSGSIAPVSGWQDDPLPPTSENRYLWNKEVITYTKGTPATSETIRVIGTFSEDGAPGENGYNQATVYLYTRSASVPSAPATNLTYTFSSGTLSNVPSPWSQIFPQNNNNPCYVAVAVAISNTDTDIILSNEWTVEKLVENGDDGRGISSTVITYQISDDGDYDPSGEWLPVIPQIVQQGKWLITRTVITYSDNTDSTSYSKAYIGEDGLPGAAGTDGNGIASTTILYAVTDSNIQPISGWQATLPSFDQGKWLWIKTTITYDNGATDESISKSYTGTDGNDGTSVTVISTSYNPSTKTTTVNMSDGTSFSIKDGEDGENGSPGAPGEDGLPSYTHFAWANSADGSQDFSTTVSENKLYIGVYADSTPQDSQSYTSYNWTLIKGADGEDGVDGNDGAPGLNQATIYLYKRSSTQITTPPTASSYNFSTGQLNGISSGWIRTIPNGTDPCYVSSAIAISSEEIDNSLTFSTPTVLVENGQDGTSVTITSTIHSGTTTTVNFSDGTSISIEDGEDGQPGTDGKEIISITEYYAISNSSTTAPTSNWGTNLIVPTADNPFLWNYEIIAYTKGASSETSKRIIGTYSAPGADGAPGKGISSIINYYTRTQNTTDTPTGWVTSPVPIPDQLNKYLWNYEHTTYTDNTTSDTTAHIIGMYGQKGADGTDGYNFVTLYYYQQSQTAPSAPSGSYSYNFSTKQISPTPSNEWSTVLPNSSTVPIWVTTISFLGNTNIVSGQNFSAPVKFSQNGENGKDGNQYTIHTMVEEIFKFVDIINSNYTNKKYEFSLDQLSFQAFDLKEQVFIPYSQSNNEKYCDLDIRIGTNNFREIIKEENYTDYIVKASQETQPAGSTVDMTIYKFNIINLYNDYYNDTLLNKLNSDLTSEEKDNFVSEIRNFFEDIESTDFVIYGQVYETDLSSSNIEKYVTLKNGLSDEMLKFSINAGGLNAAIQNTGLQFNAEGLVITNGGFTIKTQDGTNNPVTVFEIVENTVGAITNHSLYLNGTGRFTGDIYANNGYFNGEINSISGVIGGFTIGENSIISTDGNLKLFSSDGTGNSKIEVRNIDIGDGAEVSGSIKIGNLSLLNPSTYNGNVLTLIKKEQNEQSINYLTLTNNGNIIGNNWSIQKEGNNNYVTARFGYLIAQDGDFSGTIHAKNGEFSGEIISSVINASTINTANFVTEKTRAMGGAYIFKPVFEILNIAETNNSNQLEITLSDNSKQYIPELKQDTDVIIALSGNDIRYGKMISNADNVLIVEFYSIDYSTILSQSEIYNTATILGYGNYQDILIGINSDNAYTGDILPPRALVMEEFTNLQQLNSGTGDLDYHVRLFLGDLTNAPKERGIEGSGYGLYADNVFLKGSLTTSGNNVAGAHNYAGINTSRVIGFNYDAWSSAQDNSSDYTNDKIIFWGGAAGIDESQIQSSPFIVTDNGNIFARSGEFKGTVISDSLITNTIIKAPVIYGNNNKQGEPTLKIYDTNNEQGGIGFYKKVGNIDIESQETDDIKTLVLSNNGFSHYYNNESKQFLYFSESNADVFIDATRITIGTTNLYQNHFVDGNADIQVANDSINLQIGENSANSNITINPNTIINNGPTVINKNTMLITNDNKELKYTVSNGYYCLYVS